MHAILLARKVKPGHTWLTNSSQSRGRGIKEYAILAASSRKGIKAA
jgi:hypothetical protein